MSAQKSGRQYLLFRLANNLFGTEIRDIKRILPLDIVYKVPLAKPYYEGIIRFENRAIPLFNLREAMGGKASGGEHLIVVEEIEGEDIGLLIGNVKTVVRIDDSEAVAYEGLIPGIKKSVAWEGKEVYLLDAGAVILSATEDDGADGG